MRKMNRLFAVCLLAGLLLVLTVPVFAAEGTDYDALFAKAAEDGEDPLIDAMVADPVTFLEALSFQNQEIQQTVINVMAEGASISEWTVIRYLISWAVEGRELAKSEESVIAALRYAINYADYRFLRAYKSGYELKALMEESLTADGWRSEALSNEFAEAIKGDAAGFVRTLVAQEEKVRERVLGLMPYHCYWEMGNVLIDILNGIDKGVLTAEEAATVDALLEKLKDTPEPAKAVDPDPQELAAYLAKKAPQTQVTVPTVPKETAPAPTQPTLTAPVQEPEAASGISGWWLVLVPLGVAAGYLAGAGRKKKE